MEPPTAAAEALVPIALLAPPLQRGAGAESLQRQLHRRLREAILEGRISAGSRLPGSRALSLALGLSRNTVLAAYDMLSVEGCTVASRHGTRVARVGLARVASRPVPATAALSVRARRERGEPAAASVATSTQAGAAFRIGVPDLAQFPLAEWRRALDSSSRRAGPAVLGYGDALGEPALRSAIAQHLGVSRGVPCSAEQIVVTDGAQEALAICVRLLTNPGDTAWIEDPGYRGARAALHAGDLRVVPMAVDGDGMVCTERDWRLRRPRLIYLTPAHQYPLGAVLCMARRLELIAQAKAHRCWIVEDDYDSDIGHGNDPIAALLSLDENAPVVYVGTFSKSMFPALRLGFLVLPAPLVSDAQGPLRSWMRGGHRFEQLALAAFIERGSFANHLGRMRRLYRQRQLALREALTAHLPPGCRIGGGRCGMHLTIEIPASIDDRALAAAASRHRMAVTALSDFADPRSRSRRNGIVLGYGDTSADLFEPLVKRLVRLMQR